MLWQDVCPSFVVSLCTATSAKCWPSWFTVFLICEIAVVSAARSVNPSHQSLGRHAWVHSSPSKSFAWSKTKSFSRALIWGTKFLLGKRIWKSSDSARTWPSKKGKVILNGSLRTNKKESQKSYEIVVFAHIDLIWFNFVLSINQHWSSTFF